MPKNKLLIIDPQNDFMPLPNSALGVPGADKDMDRLASLITSEKAHFDEITVTLDSHAHYGVERPSYWLTPELTQPAPFTPVTSEDVVAGRLVPRDLNLMPQVIWMLRELEKTQSSPMMIWPVHCVVGTWGHAIYEPLAHALAQWQEKNGKAVNYVFKGQNPHTEHFSAVKADVVLVQDPHTDWNRSLLNWVGTDSASTLWVAGEASSHCVRFTVQDILTWIQQAAQGLLGPRVVLLEDCMSAVPGFGAAAEEFFAFAKSRSCARVTSTDLLG